MVIKQRYNVMLNPHYVQAIDKYAELIGVSRSCVINEALSRYIDDEDISTEGEEITLEGQVTFL